MSAYVYEEPEKPVSELLPEGCYDFVVVDIQSEFDGDSDKFGGTVKLALGPDKVWLFAALYAGKQKKDPSKRYDMIAPFLKAIKKAPGVGQSPDFSKRALMGSKGKVVIKHGEYKGNPQMAVDYFCYEDDNNPTHVAPDDFPAAEHPIQQPAAATKKRDNLKF